MPKLLVYSPSREEIEVPLKNEKISIGRSANNDIPILDPLCSGHHAFIYPKEDGYVIMDNGSTNGTYLNGKIVQTETKLINSDKIQIGSTKITFSDKIISKVEITEFQSTTTDISSIIQVEDVLKKSDIDSTLKYNFAPELSNMSTAIIHHEPLSELLDNIMDLICENIPMDRGVLMLKEGRSLVFTAKVVRINNDNLKNQSIQVSQSIIDMAVNKNSSVLISDSQDGVIGSNIHSAMFVPLWNNNEITGIIYSDRITILDKFTDEDLQLLTHLSNLAAIKIENSKFLEQELEREKRQRELAKTAKIQVD